MGIQNESASRSNSSDSILFSPFNLGPVQLRNRTIRAAAFEGMCPNNLPSDELIDYHKKIALGGIGMTTVAYAAVDRSGLSFPHQLCLSNEALPKLRELTESVHELGAACSIQIGHCGNMAKQSISKQRPMAPSAKFNLYGPTFPKAMSITSIGKLVKSYGQAVHQARSAGFDAVEVHAGHGYLVSQFLSPYTNRRSDEFGGSLRNRYRFLERVLEEVIQAAGNNMAVLVKHNMRDGFKGGLEIEESIEVAQMMESLGVNAIVLSGGFVSKAPMYILRGSMPIDVMTRFMKNPVMKLFVRAFGGMMIKDEKFDEAYFLRDALRFRKELDLPLVYVGGLLSRDKIDSVLSEKFELVAMARALIRDPDFINKMLNEDMSRSSCDTCNYCIAKMYSREVTCIQNEIEV